MREDDALRCWNDAFCGNYPTDDAFDFDLQVKKCFWQRANSGDFNWGLRQGQAGSRSPDSNGPLVCLATLRTLTSCPPWNVGFTLGLDGLGFFPPISSLRSSRPFLREWSGVFWRLLSNVTSTSSSSGCLFHQLSFILNKRNHFNVWEKSTWFKRVKTLWCWPLFIVVWMSPWGNRTTRYHPVT